MIITEQIAFVSDSGVHLSGRIKKETHLSIFERH